MPTMRPMRQTRAPGPRLAAFVLLPALLLGGVCLPAAAQQNLLEQVVPPRPAAPAGGEDQGPPGPEEQAPPPLPPVSELVPRAASLGADAEEALETVEEVAAPARLERRLEAARESESRLSRRLSELVADEYVSDDRIRAVADEASYLAGRLDGAVEGVSSRVGRLVELRQEWRQRQDLWTRWRESLEEDPQFQEVYAQEVTRSLEEIDGVLTAANDGLVTLARLQRDLRSAAADVRSLAKRAEGHLRTWREDLLSRTAPALLSAEHRESLVSAARRGIGQGLEGTWTREWTFGRRALGVFLFQVVLALGLGAAARWLRPRARDAGWGRLLGHPWALGVLVAAGAGGVLHGPLPPLGRLALQMAVALPTALLAAGMFRSRIKRWTVYGVSGLYALFAVLEAVAFPVPLLRVALVGLGAAGAAALTLAARRADRTSRRDERFFPWLLRAGALALALVVLAEVLGYHFFAQWLVETSVATAFVVFAVAFVVRFVRGALHHALVPEQPRRLQVLARVGQPLAERLAVLIQVVLVGWTALYLASVWDLVESPGQAWSWLTEAGVSIGGWDLTLGRLLTAAVAVYVAFVASWIVRALLDASVFDRRHFDRGVRDSIATLLHYTVIVLGVFAALSIFGLDMTNLALVAGALSVGIGFGLQNVVNNFVSGLILLFERPIRVGDVVVLGEDWGKVQKIGLRSTTIVTFNGSELIVPNGDLIAEKVTNWTLTTPRARLVLPVSVAYGTDPERVITLLEERGRAYSLSLDEPAPMAIFTSFGESSLDFELRVWLADFEQLLRARSELAAIIARSFAEEGITIPFPQRDLHVKEMPPEKREG